ncbi:phosphodiester glycosidase family protein [Streptomonospora sp. S1-112]|uniref:Phosphodiester glycosidase family protein n=1 Tax=Streptomonospora mangrovi TaxID=2883123 RepID=A0A9X3NY98_9ACTN|nr:phosphodiester glycosidase family protein [Streptomonospora mangrovi]MDA0566571.1 phosphodiester glycosidase family protein [Streptomonospora mangrovi]
MSRRAAAAALVLALSCLLSPAAPAALAAARGEALAPGVHLSTASAEADEGTQYFTTLRVDLGAGPEVDYVDPGSVAARAPLREMADVPGAVAAVNGDFFDSGASYAPLGAAARGGTALKSPSADNRATAVFDASGRGRIATASFTGTAGLPGDDLPLDRLNSHEVPADGTGVFTIHWGDHPRERAAPSGPVTEVVVAEGRVRDVRTGTGSEPVASGTRVLLGRGAAADRLAALRPGDPVSLDYRLTADGAHPHLAVGGRHVLLRDGAYTGATDNARHPRTAIGFSADGTRMFVMTADGREPGTAGATLGDMAERMLQAGAHDALELDGGGSATLLARAPGTADLVRRNRTGEDERAIPNGLVVRTGPGSTP